jgi:DUF2075 family protein
MIIYHSTKNGFRKEVFDGQIEQVILDAIRVKTGRGVSDSEFESWRQSLQYVSNLLEDKDIPENSGVAIEYKIPQTSKRIDFILTGYGSEGDETAIVIELKQWSTSSLSNKDGLIFTQLGKGVREVSHPSYQVWAYACLLKDYNEYVYSNDINIVPCAYLHNYTDDGIINHPVYNKYLDKAPVFLRTDGSKLRDFIKKFIRQGDNGEILYQIDNGQIRPSKKLADAVHSMLQGNVEFTMIDDQKVVYETAISLIKKYISYDDYSNQSYSIASDPTVTYSFGNNQEDVARQKMVFIVEGGPGTGKSVVAINLLVEFTRRRLLSYYVSKNAAPRAVYESMLTGVKGATRYRNLFQGSGKFVEADKNEFDALIVDESHRLNEKSGLYGNVGVNQIKEIINAANLSIFFLDEDQRVTLRDIGTKEEIRKHATEQDAVIVEGKLDSQFRCDGSDGYIALLDNVLQIRPSAHSEDTPQEYGYNFEVFESPVEMRDLIFRLNEVNNKSRLVAGYCWDWVSKSDPTKNDINLEGYDFSMKWNLASDGSLWIVAPESVNEIGCIHTCQGLEVDYIGVIVGPDLIVRDGKVVTRPAFRSYRIIKNTYRTLMTRGMKGCFVWSADQETREWFRYNLKNNSQGL